MKYLLITLLPLLFTGCVSYWTKDGTSNNEYVRDRQFCDMYSRGALRTFNDCMEERGWKKNYKPLIKMSSFTRKQLLDHFGLVPRSSPMKPSDPLYAWQRTA